MDKRLRSKYMGGFCLPENKLHQVEKHTVTKAIQISIRRWNGLSPVSDTQINMYSRRDCVYGKLKCVTKRGEMWVITNDYNTCVGKGETGVENLGMDPQSSWCPNIGAAGNASVVTSGFAFALGRSWSQKQRSILSHLFSIWLVFFLPPLMIHWLLPGFCFGGSRDCSSESRYLHKGRHLEFR